MHYSVARRYLIAGGASLLLMAAAGQDTTQHIVAGRLNGPAQEQKPYVILISADGFRYDYADKFHAPTLLHYMALGARAAFLQSCFPSLTFPNHYSIATGLYPAHHGIVDNTFFDRRKQAVYSMGNRKAVSDSSWYGGTPLWVLAEQQQLLSASFYWVGSESAVSGFRPTYFYNYNESIPIDRRIMAVRRWLSLPAAQRPHLIFFYLAEVDHQGHRYGALSVQTKDAVLWIDQAINKLTKTLDSLHLPLNYIFLSDHGMTDVDTTNSLALPKAVDTSQFFVLPAISVLHLYARDSSAIAPTLKRLQDSADGYDVYASTNRPAAWHYSPSDDRYGRTGDILLVPRPPRVFNIQHRHLPVAEHGFDPAMPEMHAIFFAWGPAFRPGVQIPGFENIHIYPLVAEILGLRMSSPVDGDLKVLQPILQPNPGR